MLISRQRIFLSCCRLHPSCAGAVRFWGWEWYEKMKSRVAEKCCELCKHVRRFCVLQNIRSWGVRHLCLLPQLPAGSWLLLKPAVGTPALGRGRGCALPVSLVGERHFKKERGMLQVWPT